MQYPRNAWYVAAWSEDLVAGQLLARRLLGEPVVLFRDSSGQVAALHDRCPHRFAPLSRGRLKGDLVECGYHGLCFDRNGACRASPYDANRIPPRARVASYPVLEREGIVWIWMGDAGRADPGLAPSFAPLGVPAQWHPVRGYLTTPANYVLVIDNLMDLTHPEFLHDKSLGSPALRTAHYEVKIESPRVIHSNRWFDEGPLPPLMERNFPTGGRPVEHWVNMRWHASSSLWLEIGATFSGQRREAGWKSYAAHFLTPETDTSTHYFFAAVFASQDSLAHDDDQEIRAILLGIFAGEDSPMLEAVQDRMGGMDLRTLKPVTLPGDAGALAVRSALERLIQEETA